METAAIRPWNRIHQIWQRIAKSKKLIWLFFTCIVHIYVYNVHICTIHVCLITLNRSSPDDTLVHNNEPSSHNKPSRVFVDISFTFALFYQSNLQSLHLCVGLPIQHILGLYIHAFAHFFASDCAGCDVDQLADKFAVLALTGCMSAKQAGSNSVFKNTESGSSISKKGEHNATIRGHWQLDSCGLMF